MRPTTSTATPPGSPALASPKSSADRKAAPLSDVTNLLLPKTPTPIKEKPTTRTGRRPLPTPSDASSTCSSAASVTPHPPSDAVLEEEQRSVLKSTAVARRGGTSNPAAARSTTANKGKAPIAAAAAAGTASCPPIGRTNSRKNSMAQDTRPISSSAPCHGAKKKRPSPSTHKLPEEFVKKQRAYFADVDAFELPEEEVSESELE